jgi:hypothetical protein
VWWVQHGQFATHVRPRSSGSAERPSPNAELGVRPAGEEAAPEQEPRGNLVPAGELRYAAAAAAAATAAEAQPRRRDTTQPLALFDTFVVVPAPRHQYPDRNP